MLALYADELGYAPAMPEVDAEVTALAGAMDRYMRGDAAAFDSLYAAIAPRLLGYLTGLLGERVAAEDALQQTFIRLHESRSAYVHGADPRPWIFTIGHRVALDELRRRRRARVRVAEVVPEQRADLDGTPEGSVQLPDERVGVTLAALARLPEAQRAALILTKLEGRSTAEAAQITGTTAGAIKLRAHRAYVTLRRLLKEAP